MNRYIEAEFHCAIKMHRLVPPIFVNHPTGISQCDPEERITRQEAAPKNRSEDLPPIGYRMHYQDYVRKGNDKKAVIE